MENFGLFIDAVGNSVSVENRINQFWYLITFFNEVKHHQTNELGILGVRNILDKKFRELIDLEAKEKPWTFHLSLTHFIDFIIEFSSKIEAQDEDKEEIDNIAGLIAELFMNDEQVARWKNKK